MNRSAKSDLIKWSLLLLLATAGLWFFGDDLYQSYSVPDKIFAGEQSEITFNILADSNRVTAGGFTDEALAYIGNNTTDLSEILAVYALSAGKVWDESDIPVDGTWEVSNKGIVYRSDHRWLPDVIYYVRLDGGRLSALFDHKESIGVVDTSFEISARKDLQPEHVTGVYPSADTLPRNLLKFYIHFSGPMSRGSVYEHISIRNEKGEIVPDAFLELPQELWDPLATRLTILFDPGRIKRGLERYNLRGVPFETGRSYTLVIDSTLQDGNGLPLESGYKKSFFITDDDRTMPDHKRWQINPPESGTGEALELHLDEPMDRALLHRVISVKRKGKSISGTVQIRDGERIWEFVPDHPWEEGVYRLEIQSILEDLAGNNLISVFDVDVSAKRDGQNTTSVGSTVAKSFVVE